MARARFIYGFETLDLLVEGQAQASTTALPAVVGAASLEQTIVRTGAGSLKLQPASGAAGYWDAQSGAATSAGFLRFYVRVTALPSADRFLQGSAGNIRLTSTGALELRSDSATVIGTSTTLLTDTARWYRVEISGVGTAYELRIDGVSEVSGTGGAAAGWNFRFGATDTTAATYTAYIDDIAYDDAALPGAGHVVLLRPTADSAVTNWTAGNGGATLFDAVNNTPPVGVASASETNTTNIESASSSGTATYDATMTTYAAAGIVAADTINGIVALIRHGEDIATGTKTGSFEIVSNPALAATTFTFGADQGAHAAESGGLWRCYRSTNVGTGAGVTLATAPVMRVIKTDTTTRVACIDLMGIYVDYTPGLPPELMGRPDGLHGQQQMHQVLSQ